MEFIYSAMPTPIASHITFSVHHTVKPDDNNNSDVLSELNISDAQVVLGGI